ncbi:bifunctional acyl-CoA synthetase/GNAT family N-acetyltransferase [Paracraurococcus ruber]|uniref:GNAT family N-acetyltransferase n=2 Tax=Paracraurococcus ruber TaxID=77675 RepID=A0ABS1CWN3_9PROT|nr:GNAT family N-acetyltransferase [Paracraurococcus ruber]MBK1658745.1 GNAT family N-acetyltransferase [Paracraurococcus ruber]TDG29108.1 bifunctional acyl-CoA synthetase/GNAT family N-acetyltransferase [Paracraurococcus ruber]
MASLISVRGTASFRAAAMFRPRSVVLLAEPQLPEAAIVARNLAAGGFRGSLHVIGMEAPGLTPAESLEAIAEPPDLAVLCLPPDRLEPAMADLAARGSLAAVVPGGAPDLAAISARTGIKALGQGSFGLCVPGIGLNASLAHIAPAPGKLALVTQSSALARAVLDWAAAEAVGFSHVIGIGGNATIGFAMALDWLARDVNTGAVLLDLRRIRNRRAFISAARAVARTRPVVAIRAGGRSADQSGLGDCIMEAALRRAGVLRVSGLEDLLSAAETLARVRPRIGGGPAAARGDRIAIVTNGIGLGQLAADAVLAGGGRIATLSPEALAAFALLLPAGWRPGNPLSLGPASGPRLAEAATMMAALPEVDAVVALHAPAPEEAGDVAAEAMIAACRTGGQRSAPVLVSWAGQHTAGRQREAMARAGLAVFPTPEAAVRGALQLARDRQNRAAAAELPPRDVLELAPDRATVRRILHTARAAGRHSLTEEESLGLLAAYGLPTVPGRRAAAAEDAADAAAMLGFPAVLKILSPDLRHKSEVGGVATGLGSARAVRAEAEAMLARIRARRPEARIEGFLVQRQAARALELRLRLGDDAMFGPWIGFGQGGTAADLAEDEAHDLPPLNLALAGQLIGRSRTARIMAGWRDHAPVNQAAVADALVRLSQVAVDFPEIAELTINPLFADADGVLAVDAHCVLRPAGEPGVLAIPPYPAELARPWTAKSGEVLLVRPIRPEDAAAHEEAFRQLDPEDIRWRFFSPLKEMAPTLVARLTQIDYDREIAFVATRRRPDGTEETVGVSRLIRDPSAPAAEFAVIVLRGMKGQGLGRHLMQRLFEWGRANGVREVMGHVLADNAPMLAFVRSLGFAVKRSLEEEEVMEARLAL